MSFDPRTVGLPVYVALNTLYKKYETDEKRIKQQKGQSVELYTYLATWGMMRLKAEEKALKDQHGKVDVVKAYFRCLEEISGQTELVDGGLEKLQKMDVEDYLGLTGLGLTVAQEFSFWATSVYADVQEVD